MFKTTVINIQQNEKIKEGWLQKESRFRRVWRDRWCVLTTDAFYTFENEKVYTNPTESLEIKKIKTVKTDDSRQGNYFVRIRLFNLTQKIEMPDCTFIFLAKCFEEKEAWIGAIGKAMIKSTKSNLFIPDSQ